MRIAFDATAIGSGLGGDETLVLGELLGLARVLESGDRVDVLVSEGAAVPEPLAHDRRFHLHRVRRGSGALHFGWTLPRWLRQLADGATPPDVVVTNTHAPVWSPAPVALMVTDLSFLHVPDAYPLRTRLRLQLLVARQVRGAATVLTISGFCRDDLIRSYRLPPDRVAAVPLTVEAPRPVDSTVRASLRERGVRAPYLLYLGNLHPRKNVPRALRVFRRLRATVPELAGHQFVVAGRPWFAGTAERDAAAGAPPDAVLFLDRVNDQEREVLLRDAEALVYLSTFEGFGLPPLEAMARDTPVLASDVTAIPEVCGDAAVLVDPLDEDAVAEGMRRILTDGPLRERLVVAGRDRVRHFGVDTTGAALHRALGQALRSAR